MPIRRLTWSAAILIAVGVFVPTTVVFLYYSKEYSRDQVDSDRFDYQTFSVVLSRALAKPFWDLSQEAVLPILDSIFSDPRTISVELRDIEGKIFAKKTRLDQQSGDFDSITVPIVFSERSLGELQIRYSLEQGKSIARHMIWDGLKRHLMMFGFCWIVLFLFLNYRILRPLERLRSQAYLLSDSQLDEPFVWTQNDEMGDLGRALDVTRRSLSHSFDGIKELNSSLTEMNLGLEQEVKNRTAQLSNAMKLSSLGEMAGSIAHEINNPLAVIQGQVELLSMELGKDPEKFTKRLEQIQKMIQRIVLIIRGLRNISRESKGDPFVDTVVSELINETLALCATRFKIHTIDLRVVNAPDDYLAWIQPTQISQVILNLLNNAYDAVENLKEQWVRLEFSDQGRFFEISITDSGSGITPEIRDKIMDPFFTTKPVGRGTGLGLSVSRGIIETCGGELLLDSSCPNTRFLIRIPRDARKFQRFGKELESA